MKNNFFASLTNRHFKRIQDGGIILSTRKKPSYTVEIQSIGGATSEVTANVLSDNVRSKGRDNTLIMMDEFDFMTNEAAINAAMAIQTQKPWINAVIASTPSGKRAMYWRFCNDKTQGYEEHNWSVWEANPEWSLKIAIMQTIRMPWNTYLQEYEAEFGEEIAGWIRKELTDEAFDNILSDYYPNKGPYDVGSPIRVMGVDWDKFNTCGPSFCILELDRVVQKMRAIHTEVLPRAGGSVLEEYTLGNAVQRIIQLNAQYNPHFIYLDRSHDERQVEELHQYGEAHPETGLDIKVKGIHWGSSIETIDWVTGETVKKNVKQVMAAELRIWFEERRIICSRYDTMLRKQLDNYRVVGVTQAGYKFNDDEEHLVDSMMMAMHAVSVEFDELFQKWVPICVEATHRTLGDFYGEDKADLNRDDMANIESAYALITGARIFRDPSRDMEYDGSPGGIAFRGGSGVIGPRHIPSSSGRPVRKVWK